MKCTFCSKDIPQGTGKIYVKADGKIFNFCSMKCEKNLLKLGRKPRKVPWTGEAVSIKKAATSGKKKPIKKK